MWNLHLKLLLAALVLLATSAALLRLPEPLSLAAGGHGVIGSSPTVTGTPGGSATATIVATPTVPPCGAGVWQLMAPYPIPISEAAIASQAGMLYSFGGVIMSGQTVTDSFKYDPSSNSWARLASLPEYRWGASAVSDGTYLYFIGGQIISSTPLRYNPADNSYTPLAPDYGTMNQAAVYMSGKIYRIGGVVPHGATNTVDVYTISTNTWAPAAPYPSITYGLAAVAYGGYIYAAGGFDNKAYRYDPAANRWDDAAMTDLPVARNGAAFSVLNGRLIIAGGTTSVTADGSVLALDLRNPRGNWVSLPAMPQARTLTSGTTIGQAFHVVGGQDAGRQDTRDTQRYYEVPCATITPLPTEAPCPLPFTDVAPYDYFYGAVAYLYCRGAISGYADGTFRPYSSTTRGQIAKIVVLAEGWASNTGGGPHFTDVPVSNPFYPYIETVFNRGAVSGYADGTFRWGNSVTRGQLCKIVVLAQGWSINSTGGPHFSDVPPGDPFYGPVETAFTRGIISGYADNTFKPGNSATRGQVSVIIHRAMCCVRLSGY